MARFGGPFLEQSCPTCATAVSTAFYNTARSEPDPEALPGAGKLTFVDRFERKSLLGQHFQEA
jgi:hypothetical protein